ncbi:MAG: hypothetical protein KAI79_01435, partial [Bacteroidales bacterium]|nr:hypothetical protein [Bacteroidales bacterium]
MQTLSAYLKITPLIDLPPLPKIPLKSIHSIQSKHLFQIIHHLPPSTTPQFAPQCRANWKT